MADLVYTLVVRDDGTPVIKKVAAGLQQIGVTGTQVGEKTARGTRQAREELTSMDRVIQRLQRTAAAFFGMWVMTKILALPRELISTTLEFNAQIETAKLGIASILMAQGEFTDSVGQSVQGYAKLVAAQRLSGGIVRQLQLDNLRTIATFDQLVKAFQQTVAPALERGLNLEQTRQFTVAMVQAAGALGLNLDMLAEETRSLLRGTISPRQTLIATALGITNEDVRRFQGNANALFQFLMNRLSSFTVAGMESQKTWMGLVSNLKDMAKITLGIGLEDLFKLAKREAQALMDAVIVINEVTGELEIKPDVLESLKRLGYLFEAAYLTIKDIALILSNLRYPVDILAEAWRTISISANAWADALGRAKMPKEEEGKYAKLFGVPVFKEPEWFGKFRGKGMVESLLMAWKEYNDYISKTGKYVIKEYMDYYQRQMEAGMTYTVRQRELREDEKDYLMAVANEIGYINEKLNERVSADMKIKGIEVELASYAGKQLQAIIKTVSEYDKLKDTGEETLKAFKKLLDARLKIAAIETREVPMKIAQQLAQSTDQYEQQRKFIIDLNRMAQQRLQLTGQLTPELKKQMNLQTAFSVAEIDRTKQLGELERKRDILGIQQAYAKITGDIEGQLNIMQSLTNVEVGQLKIQIVRTQDLNKRKDLEEKIREIGILSAKEQEQFRVTAITQREDIIARARVEYAEMTGNVEAQNEASRILLENEIKRLKVSNELSEDQKRVKEYYLRQIEASQEVTRNLNKQREILGYQKELSALQGDYLGGKSLEIKLLENERQRLIENNKYNAEAVTAIKEYYGFQIAIAEAQRDLDFSKLVNLGSQKEMIVLNQQLADAYQNLLPNAVGTFGDSLGNLFDELGSGTVNARDALTNFLDSISSGFRRMIIDIGMTIAKMEILKALGFGGGFLGFGPLGLAGAEGGKLQGRLIPIHQFQEGGALKVTKPTLFMAGEGKETEWIVPESKIGKTKESGSPVALTIVNVVDQRQLDMYMASSRGQSAIVNAVGSQMGTIKRMLRQ